MMLHRHFERINEQAVREDPAPAEPEKETVEAPEEAPAEEPVKRGRKKTK